MDFLLVVKNSVLSHKYYYTVCVIAAHCNLLCTDNVSGWILAFSHVWLMAHLETHNMCVMSGYVELIFARWHNRKHSYLKISTDFSCQHNVPNSRHSSSFHVSLPPIPQYYTLWTLLPNLLFPVTLAMVGQEVPIRNWTLPGAILGGSWRNNSERRLRGSVSCPPLIHMSVWVNVWDTFIWIDMNLRSKKHHLRSHRP